MHSPNTHASCASKLSRRCPSWHKSLPHFKRVIVKLLQKVLTLLTHDPFQMFLSSDVSGCMASRKQLRDSSLAAFKANNSFHPKLIAVDPTLPPLFFVLQKMSKLKILCVGQLYASCKRFRAKYQHHIFPPILLPQLHHL